MEKVKPGYKLCGIKGQAMAELGVFASIFLFALAMLVQYGLTATYEQEAKMTTFRENLAQASQEDSPWAREGQSLKLQHRQIPAVQEAAGAPSLVPVVSNASVNWTVAMLGKIDYGNEADLPRARFNIDGNVREYSTANFNEKTDTDGDGIVDTSLRRREDSGATWTWVNIPVTWTEKKEDKGDLFNAIYWATVGLKPVLEYGDRVDVDSDGHDETILEASQDIIRTDYECGAGFICRDHAINNVRYIDYQEGGVDLTVNDPDLQHGIVMDVRKKQQVSSGYIKNSLNDPMTPDALVTTQLMTATEKVEYEFRDSSGTKPMETHVKSKRSYGFVTPNY